MKTQKEIRYLEDRANPWNVEELEDYQIKKLENNFKIVGIPEQLHKMLFSFSFNKHI